MEKPIRSVVIIGGGVSGLVAAAALAQRGLRIRLLETNPRLGGCCAQSAQDGFSFNDGPLFLAMPQMLDAVFTGLGLNRSTALPLRRITANQTINLPDDTSVIFADGLDVKIYHHDQPQAMAGNIADLQALTRKWEPVLDLFATDILLHPFSLWRFLVKGWKHLGKLRGSAATELQRMIPDRALRSALSAGLLYTGLPPERIPVISLLGAVSMLRDGFFLPEGGMGRIADVLADTARTRGAIIDCATPVGKIVLAGGAVRGVTLENGELIEADAVLSTVSGMHTYGALLDPAAVPAAMQRKTAHAPLSHQALGVQLGLANNVADGPGRISYYNGVVDWMETQGRTLKYRGGEIKSLHYFVPTVTLPQLAPAGGSTIECFLAIDHSLPVDDWSEGRRDELTDRVIAALARRHRLDIVTQRVRSPREFREQLHLYQGALYGLSPTADPRALFPSRSALPGLYLAGQTTYPGFGVASACMSGLFAADIISPAA